MVRVDREKMDVDKLAAIQARRKSKSVRGNFQYGRNDTTINSNDFSLSKAGASKRVFIGGHDLEKAAEEYSKHFREIDRNL